MTDEQIEKAARELCRIRGVDPDKIVPHGATPDENGICLAILLHSPRWRFEAKEIRTALQVQAAIKSIMEKQ